MYNTSDKSVNKYRDQKPRHQNKTHQCIKDSEHQKRLIRVKIKTSADSNFHRCSSFFVYEPIIHIRIIDVKYTYYSIVIQEGSSLSVFLKSYHGIEVNVLNASEYIRFHGRIIFLQ